MYNSVFKFKVYYTDEVTEDEKCSILQGHPRVTGETLILTHFTSPQLRIRLFSFMLMLFQIGSKFYEVTVIIRI